MAVDQEMEAVFKSSRAGVDPVSGNDVPIGSLPEEVRDDVPAQLSEGEYVVPADVVRYYGVKFFEDLRAQAKMGWQSMAANGRIGGEPMDGMEIVEPEDDLPFDISELQTIEAAEGAYVSGYNEGGLEDIDIESMFTEPAASMPTGNRTTVMYKDPNNPSNPAVPLIFIDGVPTKESQVYIDNGYVPFAQATVPSAQPAPVQATPITVDAPSDDSNKPDSYDRAALEKLEEASNVDWNTASVEDFTKTTNMLEGTFNNKAITGLASMALGPIGGIAASIGVTSSERNKAYDMLDGIATQLESKNIDKKVREGLIEQRERLQKIVSTGDDGRPDDRLLGKSKIFGGKSSMYEGLGDFGGNKGKADGRVTFADTWLGDMLGFDGSFGIDAKDDKGNLLDLEASRAGARRQGEFKYDPLIASVPQNTKPVADTRSSDEKVSDAVNNWRNATAAVNSLSSRDDPADYHRALRAQSAASKAATKAIKERTAAKNNTSSNKSSSSKKSSSIGQKASDSWKSSGPI